MSKEYPEHAKLTAISDKSQACYDFMEWLSEKGIWLAEYDVMSDFCRRCEHDDPHRTGIYRVCGVEGCECDFNDRGNSNLMWPTHHRREELLAEHFGIDLHIIEQEKQAMLKEMREMNS